MITPPPSDEEDINKPIKVTTGKLSKKKNKRKKKFDLEDDDDDTESCKLLIYTDLLRIIINCI
jgi:hypothetical protein